MRKWLSFGRGCGLSAVQQFYMIEEAEHPENRKGSVFNAPVCAINRERTMLAVARAEDFRGDAVILVYEVDEGCYYGGDVHTFRVPAGHFRLIPATRFTAGAKVPVGKYSVWQALTWLRGGPSEFVPGMEPSVERLCRYADLSEPFSQEKFSRYYDAMISSDIGDTINFDDMPTFWINEDGIDKVDYRNYHKYIDACRCYDKRGLLYPVRLTVHDYFHCVVTYERKNDDKLLGEAKFVVSPFNIVTVNDMIEALRLVYARHVGAKRVNEDMQALESALRSGRSWDTDSCDIEAGEDCCTRNKLRPATANGVFGESEKFRMEKELVIAERERDDNISRYECVKSELKEKRITIDFYCRLRMLRILYAVKFCGLAGKNGKFTSKELDNIKLMEYAYADVVNNYTQTLSRAEEEFCRVEEERRGVEEERRRVEEERRRVEAERRRAKEERRRAEAEAEEERRRAEEADKPRIKEIDEKIDELCNGLGELNGSPHVKYVRHLRGLIKEYRNHSSYKRDWPDRSWIKTEDFEKYCKIVELEERIRALLCEREDRVKKPSRDSINEEWQNRETERLVGLGGSPDLFDASEFEYACGDVLWAAAKGSQDNGQVCCSDKMTAWLATKKSEIDALRSSYACLIEKETWGNNSFDKWYDKQVGWFYDEILSVFGESDYFPHVSNAKIRLMLETKFYDGSYESDSLQKYVWDLFLELWYEERIRRYYSGYPYKRQEEREAASACRESFNGFMEDAESLSEMEHALYIEYYDDKGAVGYEREKHRNFAKYTFDTAEVYACETLISRLNSFTEEVGVYGTPCSKNALYDMLDAFGFRGYYFDGFDFKYYDFPSGLTLMSCKIQLDYLNGYSGRVYADMSDIYADELYGDYYEYIGYIYGIEMANNVIEGVEAHLKYIDETEARCKYLEGNFYWNMMYDIWELLNMKHLAKICLLVDTIGLYDLFYEGFCVDMKEKYGWSKVCDGYGYGQVYKNRIASAYKELESLNWRAYWKRANAKCFKWMLSKGIHSDEDLGDLLYETPEKSINEYLDSLADDLEYEIQYINWRIFGKDYGSLSKVYGPLSNEYGKINQGQSGDSDMFFGYKFQYSWCEYFKDCLFVPECFIKFPREIRMQLYANEIGRFRNVSVLDSNYEVDSIKIHKKTVDIDNDGV